MKLTEILQEIRAKSPELLAGIPDQQAAQLARAILNHVAAQVLDAEEGIVRIEGMGVFAIKHVERRKNGHTVKLRKIAFRELGGSPTRRLTKQLSDADVSSINKLPDRIDIAQAAKKLGIDEFEAHLMALVPGDYKSRIRQIMAEIEPLDDASVVRTLKSCYAIESFSIDRLRKEGDIAKINKINHGFWEHLAGLLTDESARSSYRDFNFPLRGERYFKNDAMRVVLASWAAGLKSGSIVQMVSCSTGVESFSQVFGPEWFSKASANEAGSDGYNLSLFKKGAAKGLVAAARLLSELLPIDLPIRLYDSNWLNTSFESRELFAYIRSKATENSVCLIVGPKHLSEVRVWAWPGHHAFLAITNVNAMHDWKFILTGFACVLERLLGKYGDVVVLFQGTVVSTIVSSYLAMNKNATRGRVSFYDLGRLLDTAFGVDLTRTGSPLPGGSFTVADQLVASTPSQNVFTEFPR